MKSGVDGFKVNRKSIEIARQGHHPAGWPSKHDQLPVRFEFHIARFETPAPNCRGEEMGGAHAKLRTACHRTGANERWPKRNTSTRVVVINKRRTGMRKRMKSDHERAYKHRLGGMNGTRIDLPGDGDFFWMADDAPPELGLAWLETVLRREQIGKESAHRASQNRSRGRKILRGNR